MKKHHKTESSIGLALAGHADRAAGNEKRAEKYENPLTDFINMMIAEAKAKHLRNNTVRDDDTEKSTAAD